MNIYSDEIRRTNRYCPGVKQAEEWKWVSLIEEKTHSKIRNKYPVYWSKMDKAWIICLYKANIISKEKAREVLESLLELDKIQSGKEGSRKYSEKGLIYTLGLDEDTGSIVSLGRTLQEPMSRLHLRDELIGLFEEIYNCLERIIIVAEENILTIMPGHTHLSQAQPITFAHYLLSIFDNIFRAYEVLELAYTHTNRNTGGCGACSGIAWPVDRNLLTKLLGLDSTVEPTYDCEASQDHSLEILYGINNLGLILSKTAMDMNIWSMEEIGMFRTDYCWCGVSSFMPQKCIPGSQLERIRILASYIVGELTTAITLTKGEPHADMLPICQVWPCALQAIEYIKGALRLYEASLRYIKPIPEITLKYVKEGFSCATEVSAYLVKKGYGVRRARRIVATFVRIARERGIKPYEVSGELLDEAARIAGEKEPRIETKILRKLLDPEEFIRTHTNIGGPAPKEVKRLLKDRKKLLEKINDKIRNKKECIRASEELLSHEISKIMN